MRNNNIKVANDPATGQKSAVIDINGYKRKETKITKKINKFLKIFAKEKYAKTGKALKRYLFYFFGTCIFNEKTYLDVGGGSGILSFWIAINGGYAVCLEPSTDGSSLNSFRKIKRLKRAFVLHNKQFVYKKCTFQNFSTTKKFNYILFSNSINHLNEKKIVKLRTNLKSKEYYIKIFKKMYFLLKKNGRVIITDCSCHNFFSLIKIKNPFAPSIEWKKHQDPKTWLSIATKAGFKLEKKSWSPPFSFGYAGKIFCNKITNYFYTSHFRIEISKN